jgi:hypothetical protein
MDRLPLLMFAAVVAVIGILAASSVYVSDKNEASTRAAPVESAPAATHR